MHPQDLFDMPREGCYPKCSRCRMQVNPEARVLQGAKSRKAMHAARLQRKAVSDSVLDMVSKVYAYGEELERVEVFKYLGRLIAFDDDDTQAVHGNLKKALLVWARILRILWAENASAYVCGIFYKAAVQFVLLFGIVLASATPKRLEGFHVKVARRMTGLLPKMTGGTWRYPKKKTMCKYVGHPSCAR